MNDGAAAVVRRVPVSGGSNIYPRGCVRVVLPASAISHQGADGTTRLGALHFAQPETVYQAFLRFGASYRATVFALEREHVIGRSPGGQLRRGSRDLKRQLLGDYALKNAQRVDVWHLTERDAGAVIEASRDDLFLLRLKEDSGSGYVWTSDELGDAEFAICGMVENPFRKARLTLPQFAVCWPTTNALSADN